MIEHMAFVAYSVADVPRATAFYRDVVGSELAETWLGDELPGSQFNAAFEVDDIGAMHASLTGKGVVASPTHPAAFCRTCFITDPDGNRFALHQALA